MDIGVHQDGLVHLSQLSNRYVKDPNEVVKVHQKVQVTVTEVDIDRKRIALSMKAEQVKPFKKAAPVARVVKEDKEDDIQAKLAALKNKFN